MNSAVVLPSMYFAPIGFYSLILNNEKIIFDKHEHFVKQTFRSRCEIYGANGRQLLSVPVEKRGTRIPAKDVRICYKENWQKGHWRSIISAYGNSPFFEYYADSFQPFFEIKTHFLFDLNINLHDTVMKLLKVKNQYQFTEKYIAAYDNNVKDLRRENFVLPKIMPYQQVFQERNGFIPNLSILDLLFNCGPDSGQFFSQ